MASRPSRYQWKRNIKPQRISLNRLWNLSHGGGSLQGYSCRAFSPSWLFFPPSKLHHKVTEVINAFINRCSSHLRWVVFWELQNQRRLIKEGLVSSTAAERCSSPGVLLSVFWCFLINEGDGFLLLSRCDAIPVNKLAYEQKIETDCNDCCPPSFIENISCTSWSQFTPSRSSTFSLQPLRCWITAQFLK